MSVILLICELNCIFLMKIVTLNSHKYEFKFLKKGLMINLTQFIKEKVKPTNTFQQNKQPHIKDHISKPVNQDKLHNHKQSFQNTSQRSIGLNTLLDLQNEQQVFGEFNISRIGTRTSHLKYTNRQSNFLNTVNVKSEIQQMRQRRKALEQKVNRTLRKEQYRNKTFNMADIESGGEENSLKQSSKISQEGPNVSYSRSPAKPQIVVEQQEQQPSSQSISQLQDYSSLNSTHKKSSKQSQYTYNNYDSMRKSTQLLNKQSDPFLKYLHKEMYLLKCEKFIRSVENFKYRVIVRNLKQYIWLEDIIRRQQKKLCRFVFISWKRETKECLQKHAMIQMIKKRVQKKRMNQKSKQEVSNLIQIQPKETIQKSVSKERILQKNQTTLRQTILQKILSQKKNQNNQLQLSTKKIPKQQPYIQKSTNNPYQQYISIHPSHSNSVNEIYSSYCSQIDIHQVSPIKLRVQKEHEIQSQNQTSFYSKYSCYTEKEFDEEEEYIK